VGCRELAANRRNVGDSSLASDAHSLHHSLHGVQRRLEMDRHGALEVIGRHFIHRADLDDASVVNQHVDRAELLLDIGNERIKVMRVGHVALNPQRFSAAGSEFIHRPRHFIAMS
jgi:hypothetical protein